MQPGVTAHYPAEGLSRGRYARSLRPDPPHSASRRHAFGAGSHRPGFVTRARCDPRQALTLRGRFGADAELSALRRRGKAGDLRHRRAGFAEERWADGADRPQELEPGVSVRERRRPHEKPLARDGLHFDRLGRELRHGPALSGRRGGGLRPWRAVHELRQKRPGRRDVEPGRRHREAIRRTRTSRFT